MWHKYHDAMNQVGYSIYTRTGGNSNGGHMCMHLQNEFYGKISLLIWMRLLDFEFDSSSYYVFQVMIIYFSFAAHMWEEKGEVNCSAPAEASHPVDPPLSHRMIHIKTDIYEHSYVLKIDWYMSCPPFLRPFNMIHKPNPLLLIDRTSHAFMCQDKNLPRLNQGLIYITYVHP